MSMTEIEYADHRKFRLGDRIEFFVGGIIGNYFGTIVEITDDGLCKVTPEGDLSAMPKTERWALRSGGFFVRCRDHGVPGGNIVRRVVTDEVHAEIVARQAREYWSEQAEYWRGQGDATYAQRCEENLAEWSQRKERRP